MFLAYILLKMVNQLHRLGWIYLDKSVRDPSDMGSDKNCGKMKWDTKLVAY